MVGGQIRLQKDHSFWIVPSFCSVWEKPATHWTRNWEEPSTNRQPRTGPSVQQTMRNWVLPTTTWISEEEGPPLWSLQRRWNHQLLFRLRWGGAGCATPEYATLAWGFWAKGNQNTAVSGKALCLSLSCLNLHWKGGLYWEESYYQRCVFT